MNSKNQREAGAGNRKNFRDLVFMRLKFNIFQYPVVVQQKTRHLVFCSYKYEVLLILRFLRRTYIGGGDIKKLKIV